MSTVLDWKHQLTRPVKCSVLASMYGFQIAVDGNMTVDYIVNCHTCDIVNCHTCDVVNCHTCDIVNCLTCGIVNCHTCDIVNCLTCGIVNCHTCDVVNCHTCDVLNCHTCDVLNCHTCDSRLNCQLWCHESWLTWALTQQVFVPSPLYCLLILTSFIRALMFMVGDVSRVVLVQVMWLVDQHPAWMIMIIIIKRRQLRRLVMTTRMMMTMMTHVTRLRWCNLFITSVSETTRKPQIVKA